MDLKQFINNKADIQIAINISDLEQLIYSIIDNRIEEISTRIIKDEIEEKITIGGLCRRWHLPVEKIDNYVKRGLLIPYKGDNKKFLMNNVEQLEKEGFANAKDII